MPEPITITLALCLITSEILPLIKEIRSNGILHAIRILFDSIDDQ
jgi:hypothetical protein